MYNGSIKVAHLLPRTFGAKAICGEQSNCWNGSNNETHCIECSKLAATAEAKAEVIAAQDAFNEAEIKFNEAMKVVESSREKYFRALQNQKNVK